MEREISLSPTMVLPQVISMIACSIFFHNYFKLPKKPLGLQMIFILSLSDFILHSSLLAITFIFQAKQQGKQPETTIFVVIAVIFNSAIRFSIFWTCYMSLLVYRSALKKDNRLIKPHMLFSLTLFIMLCVVTTLICTIFPSDDKEIFISTLFLPLLLAVFVTTFSYVKAVFILEGQTESKSESLELQKKSLYLYSFIQIVTILPALIYTFLNIVFGVDWFIVNTITRIPLGLAGAANTFAYFFMRKLRSKSITPPQTNLETPMATSLDL